MVFVHSSPFLWPWPCGNTAPAVKAGPAAGRIMYHRTVNVGIMNNSTINAHNGCIITEATAIPAATAVAIAAVAVTIIYAAIKAYVRAPIACMKSVYACRKSPISGSPVKSGIRWRYPNAGHPIIPIGIIISPIARLP